MARIDRIRGPVLALGVTLLAGPGLAHPHIFIDGGFDLVFDAQGRLDRLRVTWIYDPLTSLFMLEDLGISADTADRMGAEDQKRLAAYQTEWEPGFEGDGYLWSKGARVGLSGPIDPTARVRDGKVEISFLRDVAAPFRPGPALEDTVIEAYDPSYYTAYAITATPGIEGKAGSCRTRVVPFEPDGPLAALQEKLQAIPVDGDPEGEPGALLADKVLVACD